MQSYTVTHITSSLHCPHLNGLAEKYIKTVNYLFYKAKEEGKDFYKCIMNYHNNPLTGSMQLPMQTFQGRNTRSDLPMSNAARKQLGIQPKVVRNTHKPAALPTHYLHVGQPRHYKITTRDGIGLQENTISSEALYTSDKSLQSNQCVSLPMAQSTHMQPVKTEHKKSQVNNQT